MTRLSPWIKLAYASGTITFAVKDVAFVNFVLFYYYQVLGVSGSLTGLALLLAMISDAITDPLMGSFSDQFNSRWGRRHPFMVMGFLPLACCFLVLFHPPNGWSEFSLFIWLTVFAILLRTTLTIFFIPYMALGAELSDDYTERTSVTTYRTTMGWVVALLMYWGVMRFIFRSAGGIDGRLINGNYWTLAVFSFILIVFFSIFSIVFTWKKIPFLPKSTNQGKGFGMVKTVVDLWNALSNYNFRVVFFVMVTSSMILGVLPSVGMHLGTFFWELTTKQMADVGLLMITANLFVFFIMGPVSLRIDKHHLLQFAFIGYGMNLVWFIGLRLLGLLPENGHWIIFGLFLINQFIQTVCMMIIHIIPASIIADIADEHAFNTGQRQEGVFFAAQGFSAKAVSGFGTFFGGWVLDFVGMPANVNPGQVPHEVLFKLGLITGPVLGLFFLIPWFASTRFRLSRKSHADIKKALEEKVATDLRTDIVS